jgi:hypothetical protein
MFFIKGRWLGAAVLAAALMAPRPGAAADLVDPEPARARTGLELLGFLGLDFTLLTFTPPPKADPPGNVPLLDKLTFKAWSWDASEYATNFMAHPLAGTFYYTTARSNRIAPLESLGWASLAALTWELAEYPENVSFNDLIVTPVAGASIGESLVQLSRELGKRGHPILSGLLFPMKLVNGTPPGDDSDDVALDMDFRAIAGARIGGPATGGVQFASRLVHFSGFGRPGDGAQFAFAGNSTALSFEARGGQSGLAHLHLHAGAAMASMYARDIDDRGDGWDLLASTGVGYDWIQHDWGKGPLDNWSSVRIPNLAVQARRVGGDVQVTLRADLAFTLVGARSFPIDGGAAVPIETLTTTQRAWGYTMGFGLAAAPSLQVTYGPVSLDLGASIETRSGAHGHDPWPDRDPTGTVTDRLMSVRGGASVLLPWDLKLSASLERNLRSGSADGVSRTIGENVALVGLGIAVR